MVKKKRSTKSPYRSKFEAKFAELMKKHNAKYEPFKIKYKVPESIHNYTPDFVIDNVIYEFKGRWTRADRQKILYIQSQCKDYKLIMVFQNSKLPINKGSKTTYEDFCIKHNIRFMRAEDLPLYLCTLD